MADLSVRKQISEATTTQDLSAGALSFTTSFGTDFRLVSVLIHGDAAFSQTITMTVDALAGANYDTVIGQETTSSVQDVQFVPAASEQLFKDGSELKIDVTNTGTPAVNLYVTVVVALE